MKQTKSVDSMLLAWCSQIVTGGFNHSDWEEVRQEAMTQHKRVYNLMENEDNIRVLSYFEKALMAESRGLLDAIRCGTIRKGQPRIAENLVRVVSSIDERVGDNSDQREKLEKIIETLTTIIFECANFGLTGEGHDFAPASAIAPRR